MNWVKYARKKMNMTQKEFPQVYKIAGLLRLDPFVVLKGDY